MYYCGPVSNGVIPVLEYVDESGQSPFARGTL